MDSETTTDKKEANSDDPTIQKLNGPSAVRDVYQRGVGIHCPNKVKSIHFSNHA